MTNLRDTMNEGAKEYGAEKGGNFQFNKSGTYKLRILCQPIPLATHFFGKGNPSHVCVGKEKGCPFHEGSEDKPSVKFITYVVDYQDEDKVKLAELPWAVISEIADFQENPEYAFEEYPIPYDVIVTVDKDESPSKIYKTMAARENTAISAETVKEFDEKFKEKMPEVFVAQRKDKEVERIGGEKEHNESQQDVPAATDDDAYPEYQGEPKV